MAKKNKGTRTSTSTSKAPWERQNPKSAAKHKTLSPAAKAAAKKRAQRAGRPYPNLVDNMRAAAGKKR